MSAIKNCDISATSHRDFSNQLPLKRIRKFFDEDNDIAGLSTLTGGYEPRAKKRMKTIDDKEDTTVK